MRIAFVGFTLAWLALAVCPALAHHRHHHYTHRYYSRNYSEAQVRYESCNCYFGYVGNGNGACTPATSCDAEGGRCRATCPAQTGN